jgi:hypothetical protein
MTVERYGWYKEMHDELMSTWQGRMLSRWEGIKLTVGEWWWTVKGWIKWRGRNPEDVICPVCGYYCLGKGGMGCIDKPVYVEMAKYRKGYIIQGKDVTQDHIIKKIWKEQS